MLSRGVTRDAIERVARVYRSNQDASAALGITLRSFSRLCRRFAVETPYAKRRRSFSEARMA